MSVHSYIPVVYNCRNTLLGGAGAPPKEFKPFNGTIDYDWIIWIDSDSIWEPSDLAKLISNLDHKIVTGFYVQHDNKTYAQAVSFKEDSADHSRLYWIEREKLNLNSGRIQLGATGMGFMAVKAGVFESLECPWFSPIHNPHENTFLSEDVGFCYKVQQLGYNIWGDPTIQIKHEKPWLLSGDNVSGSRPEKTVLI